MPASVGCVTGNVSVETSHPQDASFALPESAAILRYLATTRNKTRHWYPSDAQQRARVDAALDWQHSTVRAGEAKLVSELSCGPVD
jgi:glutathione S-transferase